MGTNPNSHGPIKNKISIVTGGSRGIGASIVEKLASEGSNVAFTYLNSPEKAEELVTRLAHYGVNITAYQSDASNHQAAKDLVAKVIEDFGVWIFWSTTLGLPKTILF